MPNSQTQDRLANYVPVNERLEQFYSDFIGGRVLTAIIEHDKEAGFILMRAEIYRASDDVQPAATGHAFENRNQGYVNATSYVENCETSAVGRALALLGYEIKRGIASREEMEKVDRMTPIKAVPSTPPTEREVLLKSVSSACKLLEEAGDGKWGMTRLTEYVKNEMGAASIDDLGAVEVGELLKKLSLRLDKLNNERRGPQMENMPTVPMCDCGPRKRVEGITKAGKLKGKKWAAFMCPNKVEEHEPIWIDLDEEAERAAISDDDGTAPF